VRRDAHQWGIECFFCEAVIQVPEQGGRRLPIGAVSGKVGEAATTEKGEGEEASVSQ